MLKGGKWTFDVAGIRNVRLSTLRMTTARVGDSWGTEKSDSHRPINKLKAGRFIHSECVPQSWKSFSRLLKGSPRCKRFDSTKLEFGRGGRSRIHPDEFFLVVVVGRRRENLSDVNYSLAAPVRNPRQLHNNRHGPPLLWYQTNKLHSTLGHFRGRGAHLRFSFYRLLVSTFCDELLRVSASYQLLYAFLPCCFLTLTVLVPSLLLAATWKNRKNELTSRFLNTRYWQPLTHRFLVWHSAAERVINC